MVSLCAVTVESLRPLLGAFIENVKEQTEQVNEIVLVNNSLPPSHHEERAEGRISIREYGTDGRWRKYYNEKSPNGHCIDHAVGMRRAIELASNDLILMSDVDLFYYTKLDTFYLGLMESCGLNYVGCSHFSAVTEAFTFFPNVFSAMVRRSDLPGEDFLYDQLRSENISLLQAWWDDPEYTGFGRPGGHFIEQYLMPGKIGGIPEAYPNPEGHYETGAPLYVWSLRAGWKWLSFQTTDTHTYTTAFCRGNVKPPKLPRQKLLYHATGGSTRGGDAEARLTEARRVWKEQG